MYFKRVYGAKTRKGARENPPNGHFFVHSHVLSLYLIWTRCVVKVKQSYTLSYIAVDHMKTVSRNNVNEFYNDGKTQTRTVRVTA